MGALKEPVTDLYEADFVAWTEHQAAALRRNDWDALDIANLVEEVESMGKQARAELRSRLIVLLTHLLKLDGQPDESRHHRSWRLSILEQRREIADLVESNPSLQPALDGLIAKAFDVARVVAARETGLGLRQLPERSPYTFNDAMTRPMDDAD